MLNLINTPSSKETTKIFDALVATSHNILHGSLKEKIFYLHIHKCGGASITQAIKSCYRNLDITKGRSIFHLNAEAAYNAAKKIYAQMNFSPDITKNYLAFKYREELLLYYMYQEHINYIAGHFSFSEAAYQNFSDKYAFITVLRDPVKRWISSYFYNSCREKKHGMINMEITEYLKSERAQMAGCGYVTFLDGSSEAGDYTSEKAINRVKENLHKFSIVGCLEYQKDFTNQFEERFGRRLKISVLNQSPKAEAYRKSIITEEIEEKIREICRPNIEIYQYAVDNFVKIKD